MADFENEILAKNEEMTEPKEDVEMKPAKKEEDQDQPAETSEAVTPKSLAMAITDANFKDVAYRACTHLLEKFGGPAQYLKHHFGDHGSLKWAAFAQQLRDTFPKRPDLVYLESLDLPRTDEIFKVPLWHLGFVDACSTKPPTFRVTATSLIDEYLTNTFLTSGDPILLYQHPKPLPSQFDMPDADDGAKSPSVFYLHYLKGAARATSVLMLAHVLLNELNVHLEILAPQLHSSLLAVYCRLGSAASDAASIAMENARFSARGAIRKAHDVITWAGKLHTLKQKGLQPSEIIKKFNETATKDAAIVGAKRSGLLPLLNLPQHLLELLLMHVSTFGFENCAFSESLFANKKLQPGYMPRACNDKAWQKRLQITNEGYELYLQYVHAVHTRKVAGARTKMDPTACLEALQMSQLLVSCLTEVSDQYPVSSEARDAVLQPFLAGNNTLELELQAAISESKKSWQPAELTPFKDLIATCISKRDGRLDTIGKGPKISAGQLEKQAFQLVLASLQHDVDAYLVWKAKCDDRESALYFQKLNHAAARHTRAREMAESVFSEDRGLGWSMALQCFEDQDAANINAWQDTCEHIAKGNQLRSTQQVKCVCILNWAAPAVFSGGTQTKQATLLGAILNNSGESRNLGLMLAPAYFYKKGSLYKSMENAHKLLANAYLNIDTPFAMAFEGRNDERQKRSLLQTGYLAFPGDTKAMEPVWQFWKGSDIMRNNLVKDCPLPLTVDLLEMEDLADDSLPTTTLETTHVGQAEKFQQLGEGAALKLLQATLSNLPTEAERSAILVVDLSSRTLDFAKATYQLRGSVNLPLYYLGYCETPGQSEWQRFHMSAHLATGFLEKKLPLPPGAQPLADKELPAELVTALPSKPDLGTLTWNTAKKQGGLPTLRTPDKVLQAWHDHSEFGAEFQEWLRTAREKAPLDLKADTSDSASAGSQGKKRGAAEAAASSSAGLPDSDGAEPKRLRTTTDLPCIAVADLPTPLSWSASLPLSSSNKKAGGKCSLVIAVGKKLYLVNEGTCPLEFSANTAVAGYWKGAWNKLAEGETREADVVFKLCDSNSVVLCAGKATTVGQMVKEKRAISPLDVKIMYHDMTEKPSANDPTFFSLTCKNEILFRPEAVQVKEEQRGEGGVVKLPYTSVASCLATADWETLATCIIWSVRWTARGLSPVRPNVCLKTNVQIQPGHAICFQKADATA